MFWFSPRVTNISKTNPVDGLEKRLRYEFDDKTLLEQALTHRSFGKNNNERLEFLGDAVLGYVIAETLYLNQPDLHEDNLTLLRAHLVRRDTLHDIASSLNLGEYLRLGEGERKSGGRQRASILADALEAVLAAVLLDNGIEAARQLILHLFAARLENLEVQGVKDPKTRLQELLQAAALDLPVYEVVTLSGADHERIFTVNCTVASLSLSTTGTGSTRRGSEKSAAEKMIEAVQRHV